MSILPSPPSLSCEQLKTLLKQDTSYTIFPVYQSIDADLETDISVYLKCVSSIDSTGSFLLESVKNNEYQSRFSFVGCEPYKTISQDGVDPLIAIEKELSHWIPLPVNEMPDFIGGAAGYVSYDCVGHFERHVPIPTNHPLGTPQSIYSFYRSIVAFDHVKQTIHVISNIPISANERTDSELVQQRYEQAIARIQELLTRLSQPLPERVQPNTPYTDDSAAHTPPTLTSNVGAEGYRRFVTELKEHIRSGQIIQAVPSQRMSRPLQHGVTAFDIYRSLRVVNPSPYMFYFDHGDFQIVGASPEQLVKVQNRQVSTHPIAGTRKRGRTQAEDIALEKEMLASEKERAEHIMLVDLGRNDVGRVCTPGSVKVDSLMKVERYSHVMHIVSVVSGQLDEKKTIYDAFRAVFPAGTVSGAPKIRAMQLIAGLENEQRGIYAGAVGFFSFTGQLDTAIAIRTLVVKDNTAYLQAGAGIVFDSEPVAEEKETVKKMQALVAAVAKAEEAAAHRRQSGSTR